MRAADTNVLVRIITRDDERQLAAAESFIQNGAWVSTLALAETVWVLAEYYQRTTTELLSIIKRLIEHESLILQDSDVVAAALERFRLQPALGFSDCLILELARKAGHLPLGTFDRRLAKLDGAQKL
jgi:predicted nucleic-acid-binding protein